MADTVGGVVKWNLDVDNKDYNRKMDQASDKAHQVAKSGGRSLEGFSSRATTALVAVGTVVRTGMLAAGAAVGALGVTALKSASDFEQGQAKYRVLLGSQEKAIERMQELRKFTDISPFELTEVTKADTILQGFGIRSAKQLQSVADAAAISGSSMGDLALIIGQVSQSKDLENIKQLVERGVVSFDELKKAGIRFAKDGSIENSVDETFSRVNTIIEKKFAGGSEVLGQSLMGKLSTLKDTFFSGLGQVAIESGLLDLAKDVVTRFTEAIPGIVSGIKSMTAAAKGLYDLLINGDFTGALGKALGIHEDDPLIGKLLALRAGVISFWSFLSGQLWPTLQLIGRVIWDYLGPSIKELSEVVRFGLLPELGHLWNLLAPVLIPTLRILAVVIGAGLVVAIKTGIHVLYMFTAVITVVIAYFNRWLETTRVSINGMFALFNLFVPNIQRALSGVWGAIVSPFERAFNKVKEMTDGAIKKLKDLNPFQRHSPSLYDLVSKGTGAIEKEYKHMFDSLQSMSLPAVDIGAGISLSDLDMSPSQSTSNTTYEVHLNMNGVAARSRSEWRELAKDMIGAVNEELRAKRLPEIGEGSASTRGVL